MPSGFVYVVAKDSEMIHKESHSDGNLMEVFFQKLFSIYDILKTN